MCVVLSLHRAEDSTASFSQEQQADCKSPLAAPAERGHTGGSVSVEVGAVRLAEPIHELGQPISIRHC